MGICAFVEEGLSDDSYDRGGVPFFLCCEDCATSFTPILPIKQQPMRQGLPFRVLWAENARNAADP